MEKVEIKETGVASTVQCDFTQENDVGFMVDQKGNKLVPSS